MCLLSRCSTSCSGVSAVFTLSPSLSVSPHAFLMICFRFESHKEQVYRALEERTSSITICLVVKDEISMTKGMRDKVQYQYPCYNFFSFLFHLERKNCSIDLVTSRDETNVVIRDRKERELVFSSFRFFLLFLLHFLLSLIHLLYPSSFSCVFISSFCHNEERLQEDEKTTM